MKFKITKLDRRHSGHLWFKYFITPNTEGHGYTKRLADQEVFVNIRNWLWDSYGAGAELEMTQHIERPNWAWVSDNGRLRLYIVGDEELMMLKLRF